MFSPEKNAFILTRYHHCWVSHLYGIKIYAPESKPFPSIVKYEDVAEGIKQKHYEITYSVKKQEQDVISLIENQRIKFQDSDLQLVSDETFKKIRQGQEPSPQQQPTSKKQPLWHK